ncbi:MAG: hypothetical protein U5R31_05965 [Acidimicrobiia bacterium]|nr:hypothetical protein [Acidimicrobiia bacterium]
MASYGRRLAAFGAGGLAVGALIGMIIAGFFLAFDEDAGFAEAFFPVVAGFAFVGLALGSYWGLGSRLVVEDEARDVVPDDIDDRAEITVRATSEDERAQIAAVLCAHGEATFLETPTPREDGR